MVIDAERAVGSHGSIVPAFVAINTRRQADRNSIDIWFLNRLFGCNQYPPQDG
jgi:hypothetical protein